MSVAVVIPFGGDDRYRIHALSLVLDLYTKKFPSWEIILGSSFSSPFSRARAVNLGVATTSAETIVVNDADSICNPDAIMAAVSWACESPGMVRAYTRYRRLSQSFSEACRGYQDVLMATDGDVEWEQGIAYAHGCMAIRRECLIEVGGYDEAFEGWGYEDMALELCLDARWPDRRLESDLLHLWHPAIDNPEDPLVIRNSERYYQLYEPARGDVEALQRARFS